MDRCRRAPSSGDGAGSPTRARPMRSSSCEALARRGGLSMTGGALAVWALWVELAYVRPYW